MKKKQACGVLVLLDVLAQLPNINYNNPLGINVIVLPAKSLQPICTSVKRIPNFWVKLFHEYLQKLTPRMEIFAKI